MYQYRRNARLINFFAVMVLIAILALIIIGKEQDMSQPCRIISVNEDSITAKEWSRYYWENDPMTVEISATNSEAEVGDFVNFNAEFVDNDGNVLTTVPEQTGNVYAVTSIDKAEGLWWLVQGPLTYQVGQGATSMPITNGNVKVGDLVNDDGQKVDMFGRLV